MKVLIIGNGVSIDVANAPRNLIREILEIYDKNKRESYTRDTYFSKFIDFIKEVSEGYKHNFKFLDLYKDNIQNLSPCWMLEDIEFLLTTIDLNLNNPCKVKTQGWDTSYDVVSVKGFTKNDLTEFRKIIETYLVLLLNPIKIRPQKQSLNEFCSKFVEEGDVIITFNYDLLIEEELWKLKKWTPIDGYQVGYINSTDANLQKVYREIISKGIGESKVTLFKLHGSLNWDVYPNGDLEIKLTDFETGTCYFENIMEKGPSVGQPYQGKNNLVGMPPSFIKVLSRKELCELWDKALNIIRAARQVYLIGYRLPEADVMAHFLIGKTDKECVLYLINPSAGKLKDRILRNCGAQKVIALNYKFSDWVSANFPKV